MGVSASGRVPPTDIDARMFWKAPCDSGKFCPSRNGLSGAVAGCGHFVGDNPVAAACAARSGFAKLFRSVALYMEGEGGIVPGMWEMGGGGRGGLRALNAAAFMT